MTKTVSLKALLGSARQSRNLWLQSQSPRPEAYRLFHGIAEAPEKSIAAELSIDVFESKELPPRAWVATTHKLNPQHREELAAALKDYGFKGAILMDRSNPRQPQKPATLFETTPGLFATPGPGQSIHRERFSDCEIAYQIRWRDTFQSGLFLDHAPLRQWLSTGAYVASTAQTPVRVLNTFSFTGSLSLAAAFGAQNRRVPAEITSIDLSQPVVEWAKTNAALNPISAAVTHQWIRGDVFDWLSRYRKKQSSFDLILLDPPSFSRAEGKVWSTTKMLETLIESSLALLKSGGWWMLSVNTEKMLPETFRRRVESELRRLKWNIVEEHVLELPPTFPVKKGEPETQILKSCLFRLERPQVQRRGKK